MPDISLIQSNIADELKVEGINFKGYGILPKFVAVDTDLTIEAKAIYAYFCSYAGAGNSAFPGRDKILSDLSINKDAYYKHFKLLTSSGYIKAEQFSNGGRGEGFQKNVYTIVSSPEKFNAVPADTSLTKQYITIRCEGLKSAGYGFIPKAVFLDSRLSIKAKGFYAYLCSFSGAGEYAFPKRDVILYHLGISHNSLNKYVKELTDANYIRVEQQQVNGRLGSNNYIIVDKPDTANISGKKKVCIIQQPKKQDTQIRDTLNVQQPNIQDTQKQDPKKQDTQIQDTNNNRNKINKNKNNKSDNHQSIRAEQGSEWDDETISFDILKNGNIPESYLKNTEKIEAAVKLICNYRKYSDKSLYEGLKNSDFQYSSYMLFVDALISMLCSSKARKIDDRNVTNKTVREKLGRYIEVSKEGDLSLDSLISEAKLLYEDAAKVTQPKRPLNFMQRMIWNAMVNGTIITDAAIIHDFDEETGELL